MYVTLPDTHLHICGLEILFPRSNFNWTCFTLKAQAQLVAGYFPPAGTRPPTRKLGGGGSPKSHLLRAAAPESVAAFETLHSEILPRWFDNPRLHCARLPLSPRLQRSNPRCRRGARAAEVRHDAGHSPVL